MLKYLNSFVFSFFSVKPKLYRTNSQRTLTADGVSKSQPSLNLSEYKMASDEDFDPQDLSLDLSEFREGPEEELMKLKDIAEVSNALINSSGNADWFTDPYHLQKSPPIDMRVFSTTNPLRASVMKSASKGDFVSDPSEDIRKTPITEFDMSLFKEAEDRMFTARTISGFATPYQEDLTRLKLERLRLEEERLLTKKCVNELERIRGPKPRWYELKTPDFHREARRNNNILSQSGHYQEIMDYRQTLLDCLGEEKINHY